MDEISKLLDEARKSQATAMHLRPGLPPLVRDAQGSHPLAGAAIVSSEDVLGLLGPLMSVGEHRRYEQEQAVEFVCQLERSITARVSLYRAQSKTVASIDLKSE